MSRRAALLLSLVLVACGHSGAPETQADGGHPMKDSGMSAKDAPSDTGGHDVVPLRTPVTRPLLPTSVQSLLLDPFVTDDESWGHFFAVDPAADASFCALLVRELMSQAPAGVAAPSVRATLSGAEPGCTRILAPFSGAEHGSVDAQIWVSLSDTSGNPLPFPASGLSSHLTVELLPNYLPSQKTKRVYPLDQVTTQTIAGRTWGLVSLASAVPAPQGGFFALNLVDPTEVFLLTAPQVVPTDKVTLERPKARAITQEDLDAMSAYARVAQLNPHKR